MDLSAVTYHDTLQYGPDLPRGMPLDEFGHRSPEIACNCSWITRRPAAHDQDRTFAPHRSQPEDAVTRAIQFPIEFFRVAPVTRSPDSREEGYSVLGGERNPIVTYCQSPISGKGRSIVCVHAGCEKKDPEIRPGRQNL